MRRVTKVLIYCIVCTVAMLFFCFMLFKQTSSSLTPSWNSNKFPVELENPREKETVHSFSNITSRWKSREHKTALITNTTCGQYFYLVIIVASAPANFDRRSNIRKTWALDNEFKGGRWKTVFLVGQTRIQILSESLSKEYKYFGDLVLGDYFDNYNNLTYKMQTGFEWAVKHCEFSFLLHADDDVFVNTAQLISYLGEPTTPSKELYTGHLMRGNKPFRHEGGKWSVTYEEYNEKYYPDYCSGFEFVLSQDLVALFIEVVDLVPVFKINDVYVGLLAKETGIRSRNTPGFELTVPRTDELCIPFASTLVRHGTLGECLIEIFNRSRAQVEHA